MLSKSNAQNYCIPTGVCDQTQIASVTVGDINNNSTCTNSINGYSDFTSISTYMVKNQEYSITLFQDIFSIVPVDIAGVWVDWNNDKVLDDVTEFTPLSGDAGIFAGALTPPQSAVNGPTRLRVRYCSSLDAPLTACDNISSGEAEDYTVIVVDSIPDLPGYCSGRGGCADGDPSTDRAISRVTLGDIDNSSTCGTQGYSDFTTIKTDIEISSTNDMIVEADGFNDVDQVWVWIDWNQDEDFEDADELYALAGNHLDPIYTGRISPPATAIAGETRLRIRLFWGGYSPVTSCGKSAIGEVEDYTVNVISPNPFPTADYSKNKSSICPGEQITFTNESSNTDSIKWVFEGGSPATSKLNSPVVTYITAGLFDVTLIAFKGTVTDTMKNVDEITVNAAPTVTISGTTFYCTGAATDLTANATAGSGTISSYQWIKDGSNISGATSSVYTANSIGSYTVEVKNSNGCSKTSAATTVTETPKDNSSFSYSSATYCQSGANPTPTITGASGGLFSVAPTVGLIINASTGTITLASSTPGTYNVAYTTSGPCPTSTTVAVTIASALCADFNLSGVFCEKGSPNPVPTFPSGCSAGTFSATPTGIVFVNVNTGEINLAASTPGTYTLTNVIPASGSCASASASVINRVINPAPTVTVTGTLAFCAGSGTELTATSGTGSPTIQSYQWKLNGNNIVGANSAMYNAIISGIYSVSVTSNQNCSATSPDVTVTENAAPSVIITGDNSYCQGSSIVLTATATAGSGTISTYQWKKDNIDIIGANTTTYELTSPGSYTIIISNSNGCSVTSTAHVVTETPSEDASFSYSSATFCQTGADPTPVITGVSGGIFISDPSDLVINPVTGTIDLDASPIGTYTVSYTTSGNCYGTTSITVNIVSALDATFSYSGSEYCQTDLPNPTPEFPLGSSAGTFSATPIGLEFVNVNTGEINLKNSSGGTYTVTNTIPTSGSCAQSTETTTVTIKAQPSAPSAFPISYCKDDVADPLTATGTNLMWYTLATGGTGSSTPPTPSTANTGITSYYVSQTVNGCESHREQLDVTVNAVPVSTFTVISDVVCPDETAIVTYTGTSGSAAAYNWIFDGANVISGSGMGPYSIKWTNVGFKTITLAVTENSCMSTITSQTVEVKDCTKPKADFTFVVTGLKVDFTNASLFNPTAFEWDLKDGATSTIANPSHTYSSPGVYDVCLTAINVNGADDTCKEVSLTVGIGELTLQNMINVYPIPAKDEIIISPDAGMKVSEICLLTIQGQLLLKQTDMKVNVSELENGLYMLYINTDKGLVYKKVQVMK